MKTDTPSIVAIGSLVDLTAKDGERFLKEHYAEKTFGAGFITVMTHYASHKVAEAVIIVERQIAEALQRADTMVAADVTKDTVMAAVVKNLRDNKEPRSLVQVCAGITGTATPLDILERLIKLEAQGIAHCDKNGKVHLWTAIK